MLGMKALPYVGDLARQADQAILFVSAAFKVIPLVAPEYGEAAMVKAGQLRQFQWVYKQLRT